jgi:hypothetical protein
LHPTDISIIEYIDDFQAHHEEENGTVFLAKELMGRLSKISMAEKAMTMMRMKQQRQQGSRIGRYSTVRYSRQR